jgi:hypothetical protein
VRLRLQRRMVSDLDRGCPSANFLSSSLISSFAILTDAATSRWPSSSSWQTRFLISSPSALSRHKFDSARCARASSSLAAGLSGSPLRGSVTLVEGLLPSTTEQLRRKCGLLVSSILARSFLLVLKASSGWHAGEGVLIPSALTSKISANKLASKKKQHTEKDERQVGSA